MVQQAAAKPEALELALRLVITFRFRSAEVFPNKKLLLYDISIASYS
jgi:hypothetical protein